MTNMVRVKLENGAEASVSAGFAESVGLEVIDSPALAAGRVLGPTYPELAEEAEAAASKLRGAKLDEALAGAGLSTAGSLAERQARLGQHEAAVANAVASGQVGSGDSNDPGGAAVVDDPGGNAGGDDE